MYIRQHNCVSISFDEFDEYFREKYPVEYERFGLHVEFDWDGGLTLEYYDPEDDEGKSPFILKNAKEIISNELENFIGFKPDKIITEDAIIYAIQF